jgi:hypothetical protein
MNNTNYLIPAGTQIKTRNISRELKLRPYTTQHDLIFNHVSNTGDGGFLLYFRQGNWLIAVNSNAVLDCPHVQAAPAA